MAKIWTEEHEEFIRHSFRHKTYAELAEHFGVTQKAMESKIRRMGLKKQDYQEPEPMPAMMPQRPEPPPAPVESGPTPIRSASMLPRRTAAPLETPTELAGRLEAELGAATVEKTRREGFRSEKPMVAAIKAFETGLRKLHDGSPGKAHEAFQAVLQTGAADPAMLSRTRQYLTALERQGRSAAFRPQNADEYYLLGVVRLNDGNLVAALEAFAIALERAPGDDRVLFCQAATHSQRGDIDAAIAALREAVDINDANRIYALNDPDFVPLRVHDEFRSIVSGQDD